MLLAGRIGVVVMASEASPHIQNRSLDLRETVIVGKMARQNTNSIYQMQRQLFARSERVKGIDFHPVEPWILTTLYSGMWKEGGGRMAFGICH